jgi:hypothetical protein
VELVRGEIPKFLPHGSPEATGTTIAVPLHGDTKLLSLGARMPLAAHVAFSGGLFRKCRAATQRAEDHGR